MELRIKSGPVIYARARMKLLEQSSQFSIDHSWTWNAHGP